MNSLTWYDQGALQKIELGERIAEIRREER